MPLVPSLWYPVTVRRGVAPVRLFRTSMHDSEMCTQQSLALAQDTDTQCSFALCVTL